MSLWLTARSLTNFAAKDKQQINAITSPTRLGVDQEPANTHPTPKMQITIATQVAGAGISFKTIQPKTAANSGWELIITNTLTTLLKLIATTNVMVDMQSKTDDLRAVASLGSQLVFVLRSRRMAKTIKLINNPRQNSKSKDPAEIKRINKPSKLSIRTPNAVRQMPFIYSEIRCAPQL